MTIGFMDGMFANGAMHGRKSDIGLIGIYVGSTVHHKTEAAIFWQNWVSQTHDTVDVRFGDRIGQHLWLFAEVPEQVHTCSGSFIEELARRLQNRLKLESAEVGSEASGLLRDDPGIGTAVIRLSDDRPYEEKLYEAFLTAAGKLTLASSAANGRGSPELRGEMERLLLGGGLRTVYQPIFRLKDGGVFGYEALTRCPKESRFDGPLALFRYADNEGYAFALDRRARENAIRSCPLLGLRQKMFLNVNAGIMKDPRFVSGQTVQWLAERGLHPSQIVFELTERSSIDDFEEAKKILAHYRSQGYEIAIDDAGAGYSSLQSIVELRPDYIKLDKSLVQRADEDDIRRYMLGTFVRFAKRMNIRIVAEGIERPEELRLIRSLGIDFGQGYLIGRPSETPVQTYPFGLPRNG